RRNRIGYGVVDRRQRLEEREDGLEILIGHLSVVLPRHRRQQRTAFALVLAVAAGLEEHILSPAAEAGRPVPGQVSGEADAPWADPLRQMVVGNTAPLVRCDEPGRNWHRHRLLGRGMAGQAP